MGVTKIEEARRHEAARKEVHAALPALLPRLRRFCLSLGGTIDRGDEICQEAIARALAGVQGFAPGTRLDSWLFRIARNVHIDAERRRATRGTQLELEEVAFLSREDGRQITEARSDFARVRSGFATLPEEQRVLMLLIAVEGFSYKDAAETLDIPIGTVMSRLARARGALDRHLHSGESVNA